MQPLKWIWSVDIPVIKQSCRWPGIGWERERGRLYESQAPASIISSRKDFVAFLPQLIDCDYSQFYLQNVAIIRPV